MVRAVTRLWALFCLMTSPPLASFPGARLLRSTLGRRPAPGRCRSRVHWIMEEGRASDIGR
jgi:hypothetical protein